MKIKFLILSLIHCLIKSVFPQDFLINQYNNKSYPAHQLMWNASEDAYGRIWFANNEGVLRFDGNNWTLFNTPNPVRQISFNDKGELFVACMGDFGMIKFNTQGAYRYESFKARFGSTIRNLSGIIRVQTIGDEIYFSIQDGIVKVTKAEKSFQAELYKIKNILGSFTDGKQLFVNSAKFGLAEFNDGKLNIVQGGEQLAGKQIAGVCIEKDKIIIASTFDGVYILKNKRLSKINGAINLFTQKGIAAITNMRNGEIIIGSLHDGVKIYSLNNLNEFNTVEKYYLDLPSPETYSLHVDRENNLWVGHAKGLSHVLMSLPVKQFPDLIFSGYATDMQLSGTDLYIATTSGLYKLDTGNPVTLVPVIGLGECWDLISDKSNLLVAATNGLFQVNGNNSKSVIPSEIILHLQKGNLSGDIYALGINACWKLHHSNSPSVFYTSEKLTGLSENANSILEQTNQNFWAGTYHNGLLMSGPLKSALPGGLLNGEIRIRLKDSEPVFQTRDSVYTFNGKSFVENNGLTKIFQGSKNNDFEFGKNFWLFTEDRLKQIINNELSEQSTAYCISGKPTALFEVKNKLWLAFEDKLYLIESSDIPPTKIKAMINKFSYGHSKIAYSGFYIDKNGELSESEEVVPEINYGENSLRIEFGINSFINPLKNLYSYKIDGLNKDWSDWQSESFVHLKGLNGGKYSIHVKARNATGQLSEEGVFNFKIIPPFYLSGVAYMVYVSLLILLVYSTIILNNKRLIAKNIQLEKIVNERTKELKTEKQKSEDLLHNILPVDVANELREKGTAEARLYNNVTVIFTDFVNFTGISEQLSPTELVRDIHKNFTAFDSIIEKHGLEKIKTIGDAYLAVCGLPQVTADHAQRVIKAAIDIQTYMNQNTGRFQIRIGIHSGPVVAGIVGSKKFAYDIWGDTVNTASRMESNSEAGQINISGATYELVKNEFECTYRGKLDAKNKGMLDMYFVNHSFGEG
ncbi:MAG: adenylate/guanylate cyclase domain-containing protein [Bacteroidota bacterium]|nr:adenylate/guanylate cyclase domain-containing protein [Bacteroidota bacterium]